MEWGGRLFGYCRDQGEALNHHLNQQYHRITGSPDHYHNTTITTPGFTFNTINMTGVEEWGEVMVTRILLRCVQDWDDTGRYLH